MSVRSRDTRGTISPRGHKVQIVPISGLIGTFHNFAALPFCQKSENFVQILATLRRGTHIALFPIDEDGVNACQGCAFDINVWMVSDKDRLVGKHLKPLENGREKT